MHPITASPVHPSVAPHCRLLCAAPDAADMAAWQASLIGPAIDFAQATGVALEDAFKLQNVFHRTVTNKPPCELELDGLWVAHVQPMARALGMPAIDRIHGQFQLPASRNRAEVTLKLRPEGNQSLLLVGRRVIGSEREDGKPYFYSHHLVVLETDVETADPTITTEGMALTLALNNRYDGEERSFAWNSEFYFPKNRANKFQGENRLADLVFPANLLQALVHVARAAGFPLDEWSKNRQNQKELQARQDTAQAALAPPSRYPGGGYAGAGSRSGYGAPNGRDYED